MIIDNKGKLFGKINIIDICVILIVVLALAMTYFKFNLSAHSDVVEYETTVTYTIQARNLRSFTLDGVEIGDKLYDHSSDKYSGTIVDKNITPATEYLTRADGTIVKTGLPERYDLELTVESPALIKNGMVVLESGKSIHLNQTNSYYTQKIQTDFETMDIKINE
ncbi:MAG: DUF4330 domain-containing protein [Clostridia bacterium]|nr:DUF4330 domain-containing protein [Clostridia bacterium]